MNKKLNLKTHNIHQQAKKIIYFNIQGIYHNMVIKKGRDYELWIQDNDSIIKYETLIKSLQLDEFRCKLE